MYLPVIEYLCNEVLLLFLMKQSDVSFITSYRGRLFSPFSRLYYVDHAFTLVKSLILPLTCHAVFIYLFF